MSVAKPDTRAAFAPSIPSGPDITNPAISAIRFDGKLDRSILSAQIHQVLLGMARSRNAVSSFRLEGENVDLERARQVLETQSPESPAERGVLQLSQAYRAISEGRLPEFTIRGFEEAHREIFTGVLDNGIVGELKTSANVITDVTGTQERFRPTPPENVRADLDALLLWLEQNQGRLLPTVVAAIFFAEFEAIHPFSNGNGRLGRYLNIALLRKLGLKNSALIPLDTRFFRTSDHYYEYSGNDQHRQGLPPLDSLLWQSGPKGVRDRRPKRRLAQNYSSILEGEHSINAPLGPYRILAAGSSGETIPTRNTTADRRFGERCTSSCPPGFSTLGGNQRAGNIA